MVAPMQAPPHAMADMPDLDIDGLSLGEVNEESEDDSDCSQSTTRSIISAYSNLDDENPDTQIALKNAVRGYMEASGFQRDITEKVIGWLGDSTAEEIIEFLEQCTKERVHNIAPPREGETIKAKKKRDVERMQTLQDLIRSVKTRVDMRRNKKANKEKRKEDKANGDGNNEESSGRDARRGSRKEKRGGKKRGGGGEGDEDEEAGSFKHTGGMSDKEVKMKMKVHARQGIKPTKGGPDALRRQLEDLEAKAAKRAAKQPSIFASEAGGSASEGEPEEPQVPIEVRLADILEQGSYSPDTEGDNRALASKIAQSVKKKAKWQNAEHYLPGFLKILPKAFESSSVQRLSQGVFCADLLKYIWNMEQEAEEQSWRQQGSDEEYDE